MEFSRANLNYLLKKFDITNVKIHLWFTLALHYTTYRLLCFGYYLQCY